MPGAVMTQQTKTEIVIAAVDKATATLTQIGAQLTALETTTGHISKLLGKLDDTAGFAAVKKAAGSLKGSILSLGDSMVGVGRISLGAVTSITSFGNNAVDAAGKIGGLSARYQINAEALQVYGSLVQEAGGTTKDAADAMGALKQSMAEAINGGKEQTAAFAGLGISIENLKKMSPEQVMEQMADTFKGSERDMSKQSTLLELMGQNGAVFMDVMNKGGDEYRARLAEMRADGSLLSADQLQQADEYDKSWKRLQRTVGGLKTALGLKLANALEAPVQSIQKWIVANRALIDQKFDVFLAALPDILAVCKEVIAGVWRAIEKIGGALQVMNSILGPTGSVLLLLIGRFAPMIMAAGSLALAIGKIAWSVGNFASVIPFAMQFLSRLWSVILANPIGLLVAAVIGLGVIIYENWDSIVQYVSDAWERIKSVFDAGFFDGLIQLWLESWQTLANGILGIIKTLLPDFLMPDVFKDFKFSFASDRAEGITTAAAAAQAQRQEVKNVIRLEIDADGWPRVKEMRSGSQDTTLDVMAGLSMVGA